MLVVHKNIDISEWKSQQKKNHLPLSYVVNLGEHTVILSLAKRLGKTSLNTGFEL